MVSTRIVGLLLLGVMITGAAWSAPAWLATGTVTKVDGSTIYFLSRNNSVYRIDASDAKFFGVAGSSQIAAGAKVRIYGCETKPRVVKAARIRVLGGVVTAGAGPQKEMRVVVEKENPPMPPTSPLPAGPTTAPAVCAPRPWEGKGIVTDIDWAGRQVSLQTSDTLYTIDIDNAAMVRGTVRVSFGQLNVGDTIWVSGSVVAVNLVDARMVRVLRGVSQAQGALPLMPVQIVGVIEQVDYPSRTFRMRGPSTTVVVSIDDNTDIYFRYIKKCFGDLKPGTKVSMSGAGSLGSGYAAQYIEIIGGP